ncbi:MAG TPA: sulfotransferase [Candidatus Eisenbacteria bacterium]|nr:sulfotransferase [Candidatus Eisenbacteria bacterium]
MTSAWPQLVLRGARIFDGAGRLVRLDPESLLAGARRRTGLDDFGDPSFRDPLRRLMQSIEEESRLSIVGRIAARHDLTGMLMNRLLMERDRRLHPAITDEQIRRPLFILGLPRSGSTFLHGLLAQDPANRVPRHWELRSPSPPPDRATYDTDPRIERAARDIRWFLRLAPRFKTIHPVGAQLPEECVVILSHSFLSFQFSSTWFVPSYQSWLDRQDLRPAYRYHRQFLQNLQWRCPGERWVLKAPPHLPGLRALCATYPDANMVVTHRDPLEVVASVTSLHVVLRQTFSAFVDPVKVGDEVTRLLADDIRRGFEARDEGCAPPERFVDVQYTDLVRDPMGIVRRIYRHFDLPLSAEAEQAMQRHLGRNRKDAEGPHVYSLAEFGLDERVERERYRAYWDRWGVPAPA